jgi:hypothetical protein
MDQIYPDVSLVPLLQLLAANGFHFHLYTNNATIDRAITLGGLTEAAWSGYAPVNVTSGAFTLSSTVGHVGSLLAAPIAFVNASGSSQTAYGYFITDTANTTLYAAAQFDSAPITKVNGDSWIITPVIGDFSGLSV